METPTPTFWDRLPSVFRALRHRNFRLFMMVQLISLVGTWMDAVAEQWLVYRLTGSATMLGLVGFAGQIPSLLLGPLGGTLADRFSRHKLIIATQSTFMVLAFILAGLTISGHIQIWETFVLAALMGSVNALDVPTRQSFVVEMTSKDDLMNAIALNSSMFNASRIIGPALAGLLVAWVGEGWCFMANAVSFIAVITGLLLMRVHERERVPSKQSALQQMAGGFRFVMQTPAIRGLLLLTGLTSIMGTSYSVLMPIFANKILGGGAQHMGILMGASGVGALGAALTLASRKRAEGLGRWVAAASCSFGLCVLMFGNSTIYWLSVILLVPVGYSIMLQMGSTNTLLQVMVPDELRGRVMALYSMMFMGMMPIGSLLSGTLADHIGAPRTVTLGGLCCCLTGLVFTAALPKLRESARPLMNQSTRPSSEVPGEED